MSSSFFRLRRELAFGEKRLHVLALDLASSAAAYGNCFGRII